MQNEIDSETAPLKDGQESLTTEESARLIQLEAEIERTIETGSLTIANALKEIRDARLYRTEYHTFKAYVRARWHYGRSHAYRLIDFAKAMSAEAASPNGDTTKWKTEGEFRAAKNAKQRKAKVPPNGGETAESTLELERKLIISLDAEFDSFSRFLSRLDGGLSTEDYLQLLARMRDQLDRMYGAKEAKRAKALTMPTSPELEEVIL